MKAFLFFLILGYGIPAFSQPDSSLVLSEVMFNAESGNNEFIELYNRSTTESIDLSNYKIKYHTSTPDIIISSGQGTILPPNSFAVIFEGDYDFASGIYNTVIPQSALILKTADNSFGASGMANSTDRTVWLINNLNDTLDVYTYSANNTSSYSDEKKVLNKDSSKLNWSNSLVSKGTPGFKNSVTQLNYDLALTSINISPLVPIEGDDVEISFALKNNGVEQAQTFSIKIYNDLNHNSTGEQNELIFSNDFTSLSPNDSLAGSHMMNSMSSGTYTIIGTIEYPLDENILNNFKITTFSVYPPAGNYNDIIINEIMYAPSSGEPEWIELFNRSSASINLSRWRIADNSTTFTLPLNDVLIQPDSFIVISRDSTIFNFYSIASMVVVAGFPSLNNTGDAVVIKDSNGTIIDSILYSTSWGGNSGGKSLERISSDNPSYDPGNWGSSLSINKATPGKYNSITPKNFDLKISSFKPEKSFAITGEIIKLNVIVKNIGIQASSSFALKLFNDANQDSIPQASEMINEKIEMALSPGDSAKIIFETGDFIANKNIFIALLEFENDEDETNNIGFNSVNGVAINEVRNDLIINEIMYAPVSQQPEWIEIFNRSDKVINLNGYKIADNSDTAMVVSTDLILEPKDYIIVATDSSIFNIFNIPSQSIIKSFPSLNNSSDKVILLDSLNRTIDSLQYFSTWGGGGKSLERINYDEPSLDSINWKATKSKNNGTPGSVNSRTQKDFDIEVTNILFSPEFPLRGDIVSVTARVKNPGKNNFTFTLMLFEDTDIDSIFDVFIEESAEISINAGDSSDYIFNYKISNINFKKAFYTEAVSISDQDTSNNYFYKTIEPGYPTSSVLINEIMFTPVGGEPEWVEFYNTTEDSINLNDWTITDVLTNPSTAKILTDIFIPANSFLVITKDSSILNYHRVIPSKIFKQNFAGLNNDADGVTLKDNRSITIDSVFYRSDWGGLNGYSLERKSLSSPSNLQANWNSSKDFENSTPGRINSITTKQVDISAVEISFEPRFPAMGENIFISAKVKNFGVSPAQNFIVKFFIDTDSNKVVDLLLDSKSVPVLNADDSISITSSLPINNLSAATLAAIRVEYEGDEDTLNNYIEKIIQPGIKPGTLIINELMYDPANGEPEWIELINISGDTLNLKNWSVSDVLSTPAKNFITNEDLKIRPGELFIICKDTSFYQFHPEVTSTKIKIVNFGSLGNSTDGIIIYDFRNGIIDSLLYKSNWGGRNGYSLERISFTASTTDSSNWATCLDAAKSTPGLENSLVNILSGQRNQLVINEIMFDPDIDNNEFIEFINLSSDSINIGGWRIEDGNANYYKLSETSLIVPPGNYFALVSDSVVLKKYNLFHQPGFNNLSVTSLGLSNSGELILLKDLKGNVIDSVYYSDKWHNKNLTSTKNISLERINPHLNGNESANWSSSVSASGATPCEKNSIFTINENKQSGVTVSPNPFSPDNDGFEDFAIINYNLTQAVAQVRIKIYDSQGRLVRTLANNQSSGSSGSVIFNGFDDSGSALRIGIYIIFLEALNENSGSVETLKNVVVVARKL